MAADYRFGIEEEFFLADAATRGSPRRTVRAFHAAVHDRMPDVERELLQAQVEIASPPTADPAEARGILAGQRAGLAAVGRDHGILVLASGTHPVARWQRQRHTRKPRYEGLIEQMQMVGRRNIVCGMHVHVEVPAPDDRVTLMGRLLPFTPLLLALSASSPFWQGQDTGLSAYRMSVWGELPRTGLPDLFIDQVDYERYVAAMVGSGAIEDASFLWWTLRPSIHYPTLELRVADSCTRVDDAVAIAQLYRCLVRRAVRQPALHPAPTGTTRALTAENLWRAQRDGVRAAMVDVVTGEAQPFAAVLDALLADLAEDADALGCARWLAHARRIAAEGTSADRQREAAEAGGPAAAVDWIAAETA